MGIIQHCLNRAKGVGSLQKTKGIMQILRTSQRHQDVGKEFLHRGLNAGHLYIGDAAGGIAGQAVIACHLHTVNIILAKLRDPVGVIKVIHTCPHRYATIEHRSTLVY
ncbi:hypothetical protein ES703_65749 [subsurface metagenome]